MDYKDFEKIDTWRLRHERFCIEVIHFMIEPSKLYVDLSVGNNRWNIHAYIYPTHPLFNRIIGNDMFQIALCDAPLHGGCSTLVRNYFENKEGKVECTSIKFGADYNHLHDREYTRMDIDDVNQILYDAQKLFSWLDKME